MCGDRTDGRANGREQSPDENPLHRGSVGSGHALASIPLDPLPEGLVASADQLATQAGMRASGARWQRGRRGIGDERRDRGHRLRTCAAWVAICSHSFTTRRGRSRSTPPDVPAAGADAAALRAEGRTEMPFRHDIRSVTVPGCVDGWMALHERFATLPSGHAAAAGHRARCQRIPCEPAARRARRHASTKRGSAATSPSSSVSSPARARGCVAPAWRGAAGDRRRGS